MNSTYNSTETSDAAMQQGLDSITGWLAREALVLGITVIAIVVAVAIFVKLFKNAVKSAKERANQLADEQRQRVRHDLAMAERERAAANVKERLRRVREKNELKAVNNGNVHIPVVSLKDMVDPIVGSIEIPILSLNDMIDSTKIEGMEIREPHVRKDKNKAPVQLPSF